VRPRIRRWDLVVRLFVRVMRDILRSNFDVALLILPTPRARRRRSGFVEIDLTLREPTALAVLAVILTATPGTAWIDYDAARGRLLIHVFDLVDEDAWRDYVVDHYERLLREIFE
jgi:multicomponent K+:H+ antiporter subunit E